MADGLQIKAACPVALGWLQTLKSNQMCRHHLSTYLGAHRHVCVDHSSMYAQATKAEFTDTSSVEE